MKYHPLSGWVPFSLKTVVKWYHRENRGGEPRKQNNALRWPPAGRFLLTNGKGYGIIMADNRIAYGLAKKYGIDTKGMTPKEVWDALNEKGVTRANAAEKYTSDGMGGEHEETPAEKKRLKELGVGDSAQISKQEYAVLRSEVMRKNAAQKGKVQPVNFAYTSNYFYVYETTGDDDFEIIGQLDIENEKDIIDKYLKRFGG